MTAPTVPEMKDGLLPCPFCGGPAREWEGGDGYATIGCEAGRHRCRAQAAVYDHRDRAIAAWNTRAMIAATQQATGGEGDKGNHDCLAKRRPGEPMFILLGRDPDAHNIVRSWAERRLAAGGDPEHCQMGLDTAERMRAYASDPANAPASAPPASAYPATQQAVSPPEGVGETVAERAIRHLSRLVRVYGDMLDGNGNTPTEIRHAERFLESLGSLATARPHRNAADGGSGNEGGE